MNEMYKGETMKKETKTRFLRVLIFIIALITLEQLTKVLAIKYTRDTEIVVIKDVLSFSYLENTGIAFGIAQNNDTGIIILLNIIVIAMIIRFMVSQQKKIGPKTMTLLSIAVAGGISNLIDRIFRGYVVDFINILLIPSYPRCNVADVLLVVSWIVLVFILVCKAKSEMRMDTNIKVGEEKSE